MGNFHSTPVSSIDDDAAPDISLPHNVLTPDVSHPDISTVDTSLVADAFQFDDSVADVPMSDVPTDQARPELPTVKPPSRAWDVDSASVIASSRGNLLDPPFNADKREVCCFE